MFGWFGITVAYAEFRFGIICLLILRAGIIIELMVDRGF